MQIVHLDYFFPKGPISNKRARIQIAVWFRIAVNASYEPLMVQFSDVYAPLGLDE